MDYFEFIVLLFVLWVEKANRITSLNLSHKREGVGVKDLFSERGEGSKEESGRNINVWLPLVHPLLGAWPTTQACALTGNPTSDL